MTRKTLLILPVLISLQLSVACSPAPTSPTPQANMPNPASVHCEQNGGKLELRQDASGGITGVLSFWMGANVRSGWTSAASANQETHAPSSTSKGSINAR